MRGIPQPAQWAIRKASELGAMMAKLEVNVVPNLDLARQFPSYVEFIKAHRGGLEKLPSFAFWNQRLKQLVEQERMMLCCELGDSDRCKDFNSQVAFPMRCAFWYGWEMAYGLKRRYELLLSSSPGAQAAGGEPEMPPHPRASGLTPVELLNDDPLWDMLANRLIAKVDETPEPVES